MQDTLPSHGSPSDMDSPTIPTNSTFSFKAPYPMSSSVTTSSALKQRRISMASPSSPRVVPASAWSFRDDTGVESHVAETVSLPEGQRGKMRRIANDDNIEDCFMDAPSEKKLRKKWTKEETDMLVKGCNTHGVGNWKTILNDPNLRFDHRTPVDLKDRFRTYFPDAYKLHYPNAKTHLSSKVRAINPDGSSLFEKTRSKKRRPFTPEEDRALKAGYERHGTVWAAIVKDPVFQAQNRRSTDLRDRFRNAFPDLYQAAGYKPRTPAVSKKARGGEVKRPVRAATDDQLAMSTTSTGPLRRRRANTSQSVFRGGTKSVPQSARESEDEASSDDEENMVRPPLNGSTAVGPIKMDTSSSSHMDTSPHMDPIPDFGSFSQIQNLDASTSWPSGVDTPVHSHQSWSGAAGSPTTSHPSSDMFSHSRNMGMIGKSAWGTQDWFSASPRMDSSSSVSNSGASSSSFLDDTFSSPFSFHHHLNHGVMDRYDLLPATMSYMHTDFSTTSEFGMGDHHSTFSDEVLSTGGGFRGFTHHSNTAGDLIFGARTHQPQGQFGLGFGSYGLGLADANGGSGGAGQQNGINPMQLHTPSLPNIVEMELAGMALDDRPSSGGHINPIDRSSLSSALMSQGDNSGVKEEFVNQDFSAHVMDDDLLDMHSTPPATPHISRASRSMRRDSPLPLSSGSLAGLNIQGRSFSVPPTENRTATGNAHTRPSQLHALSHSNVSGRQPPFYAATYPPPSSHSSSHSTSTSLPSFADQSRSQSHGHNHHHSHSSVHNLFNTNTNPNSSPALVGLPAPVFSYGGAPTPTDHFPELQFLDLHLPRTGHSHNHNHHEHQHQALPLIHTNVFGIEDSYHALDLASAPTPSTAKPLDNPPPSAFKRHVSASTSGNTNGNGNGQGGGGGSGHQRGQSVDLLVASGTGAGAKGDNKRKRSSWDGAPSS